MRAIVRRDPAVPLLRVDALATLFAAAALTVYVLWSNGTALTGLSVRGVGTVVFVLGMAACIAAQEEIATVFGVGDHQRPSLIYAFSASIAGAGALVAGGFTIIGGSEGALGKLAALIALLWIMATVRHAIERT